MSEVFQTQQSRQRLRVVGTVLWPSFLVAAVATMVFFANIDPDTLRSETFPALEIGRKLGYTVGFFMFWAVGAASSYLTLFLYRVPPHRGDSDE